MSKSKPKRSGGPPPRPVSSPPTGVPLAQAPFEFWDFLFPGSEEPALFISKALVKRMWGVGSGPTHALDPIAAPSLPGAFDLQVRVEGLDVTMLVPDINPEPRSLFNHWLGAEYNPRWRQENPIDAFLRGRPDRIDQEDLRRLFLFVVDEISRKISNTLRLALENGQLVASGLESNSLTAERHDIPPARLQHATISIRSGVVSGPLLAQQIDVRVRRAIPVPVERSGGPSFAADDAILIEEMHELRNSGAAKSVLEAASRVASKARSLGSEESVIERLRKAYGTKYPTRPRR